MYQTRLFANFYKIDIFEKFAKFTGKHAYRSPFFNKVTRL